MGVLIGIGHKKRRGKDSAANRLVDKHGFVRVSWADSLKEAARIIFGWDDRHLYGDLKEKVDPYWGFTPRWALQTFGTEACRDNIDTDIWVKSAWLRVQRIWEENPDTGVVIPDVRFPNEADYIANNGGSLWRIDRDIPEDENSQHASEIALDDYNRWNEVLVNNGSLADLYAMVDHGLEHIRSRNDRTKRRTNQIIRSN